MSQIIIGITLDITFLKMEAVSPKRIHITKGSALQDLYMSQPAVVIGFVSVLTGCVLQDDLMACARSFMRRGLDILGSHVADCAPQVDPCAKHPPAAHTSDSGLIEGILDTIPQIRQAPEASTSSTAVRSSDF